MKKNFILRLLTICVAVLLIISLVGCGENANDKPVEMLSDCSVTVQTEGGVKLAGVGVSVYADEGKTELVDFVRTDDNGIAKFNTAIPSGSYVFLTDVPDADGYVVHRYYTIDGKCKDLIITLSAALKNELSPIRLGNTMFDFTVTDQNGTEHTLSKLLENKKAVILNLWYTTCGPCKMEFPYLQRAYNEYQDNIGLLALSPIDDAAAVAAFAAENGLTIPMASCDPGWGNLIENIAYPTTIVVDRFGTVALIHIGWIDSAATFKNLFAHFVADDYQQSTFADMSTFEAEDEPIGTSGNPYVHSGSDSFSVDVEAGQTVYYSLYGAEGLELTVSGSSLKLACNEKEYTPSNGKIAFAIPADASSPVSMVFSNTGSKKETYKVSFKSPEGSAANPITMKDGTTTVKLAEGNSRGMHYLYKATGEGTLTLECINTVNYTVTIKNLNGNESGTLDKNNKKVTIDVRKNDQIQIIVTAVAKDGKYPATEAKLKTTFQKDTVPTGTTSGNENVALNTNGKLVNPDEPIEYGGTLNFNAEVKAGEMVLYHIYRVSGTTLRIVDGTAYVIYKDTTYTPDKTGCIYIPVTSDSPNNPIVLKIGNGGKTDKTYAVKFSFPEGSMMNPYDAVAGTIKINIAANNEQGVYYKCIAEKDGKMTIVLKNITSGVSCDILVTVTDSSYIPQQYTLSGTDDGKTLTIDVYADDEIQINIVTIPDENFKYPAATIETVLSFS